MRPSISVVIAYRDDRFIWTTLNALPSSNIEIIIVDDCSEYPLIVDKPNVKVIRNSVQKGIGWSFDKGVSEAKGDIVVLTGSDVVIKNSDWIDLVTDYCNDYPKGIGCSTCLSLDPTHLDPNYPADDIKRYGARIIPLATTEDLPSDSELLGNDYRIELFEAKWMKRLPVTDVSEVPCTYGAMYFTNKSWYNHIGGWDTVFKMKLSGHKYWGGLEQMLCIKNWLLGGQCHVLRNLESGHVFHKFGNEKSPHGRKDFFWYNKFFIAYTLMDTDEATRLVRKIYSLRLEYGLFTYPFNLGKQLLKTNMDYVMAVRERNKREMVHDFDWFLDKFKIEKIW